MQSLERLADYPLFLEGGGQLIRDKSGKVLGAVGVIGDANELMIFARLPVFMPPDYAPTATFSTIPV